MRDETLTFHPLTPDRWRDLETLFGPNGGPYPTAHTGLCKNGTRCANTSAKLLVANKVDATPTQRLDTLALAPAVADGTFDAALVYRTSAAPLGPKLTLVPLDPPTIGQVEFHMLRFTYSTSAAQFEAFLSTDAAHHGLLLHSVYHWPNGWDHVPPGSKVPRGESSQWGDYHLREVALYVKRLLLFEPNVILAAVPYQLLR